jgi:hypothetical protein
MRRVLLIFAIVIMAMGSNARAGTVFQFTQTNLADQVTATDNGGVTTLSTAGNTDGSGVSIPVSITGPGIAPGTTAFETYVNVTSTGPATESGGLITQAYSGTIEFTSIAGGGGINFLTADFTNVGLAGTVTGPAGGTAASLAAANPPNGLTLTSGVLGELLNPTSMAVGFSNVSPFLTIASDGSIDSFVAQNAGTFGATLGQGAVPEPSSIMLSFIGIGMATAVHFVRKRRTLRT